MLADAATCDNATPFFDQVFDRMTSNSRVRRDLTGCARSRLFVGLLDVGCLEHITSIDQVHSLCEFAVYHGRG